MIYVIDDDEVMARCVARACGGHETKIFGNVIEAMNAISNGELPDLVFLDVLLDGPDGFTFLNELISYTDTARVPVVIVSSLDFAGKDLSVYGVVGVLDKTTMTPKEVKAYVQRYCS